MSARWFARNGKTIAVVVLGSIWLAGRGLFAGAPYDPVAGDPPRCERRPIDLVICLDTSNSMHALIDSARGRLWDIVTSLARAKPTPRLRVGLLTYGSPSRAPAAEGFVVRQMDLTTDLDALYARMMSFTTDGGDEFVGWVLRDAVERMSWSNDPRALKLIFVAGNESADQASEVYNFRNVAEQARGRGITINAIYAGDRDQGIREAWDQVARCGGGSFSAIDMRCGTVQIGTPHDQLLLELNMKLNATYVPYGSLGPVGEARQREQDDNAGRMGQQSASSRVAAKASALYQNEGWDLVDAVQGGKVEVERLADADLPEPLRRMSTDERQQYVEQKARERASIQQQIAQASAARDQFLQEEKRKQAGGKVALDEAMLKAIRDQAESKGFTFE
jgi:hypothetical protein